MRTWSEFQSQRFFELAMELKQKHAGDPKAYMRELSKAMLAQASNAREREQAKGMIRLAKSAARFDPVLKRDHAMMRSKR